MNLYDVTVILTVEAEDADGAWSSVADILRVPFIVGQHWIKDYDIESIRELPLIRMDEP